MTTAKVEEIYKVFFGEDIDVIADSIVASGSISFPDDDTGVTKRSADNVSIKFKYTVGEDTTEKDGSLSFNGDITLSPIATRESFAGISGSIEMKNTSLQGESCKDISLTFEITNKQAPEIKSAKVDGKDVDTSLLNSANKFMDSMSSFLNGIVS